MPKPAQVDLRPYFLTLPDVDADYSGALDWPAFFGNDHPMEIDVGSGRGLFLVTAGSEHPGVNYLGIELDYREGRRAARRLQKRELSNVRVLGADVNLVFAKYIAPHSVAAIHVYFPDPWWKKKHRRRRVFTDAFVDQCARLLQPGGLLHSRTDVEEYFEIIAALMNHHREFERLPPPPLTEPQHDMDYTTSYERKKRKLGLPIFRGVWRRRAIAPGTSSATHPSPPPTPYAAP
jgi:tRNA (guanine-N7-)-methyltransferase